MATWDSASEIQASTGPGSGELGFAETCPDLSALSVPLSEWPSDENSGLGMAAAFIVCSSYCSLHEKEEAALLGGAAPISPASSKSKTTHCISN